MIEYKCTGIAWQCKPLGGQEKDDAKIPTGGNTSAIGRTPCGGCLGGGPQRCGFVGRPKGFPRNNPVEGEQLVPDLELTTQQAALGRE